MSEVVIAHITQHKIYEFEGWLFEYYRTKPISPWPLKKDHEPRKRAGRLFWDMFERFSLLTVKKQELCRK